MPRKPALSAPVDASPFVQRVRRLELGLATGSITSVSSRAYVFGLFQGVPPAGAALAVDERMGGVILYFVTRRSRARPWRS